jgi:hypothetical protein
MRNFPNAYDDVCKLKGNLKSPNGMMDKWTELRETIEELHENNADKPDVVLVTDFLLRLMKVLDEKQ